MRPVMAGLAWLVSQKFSEVKSFEDHKSEHNQCADFMRRNQNDRRLSPSANDITSLCVGKTDNLPLKLQLVR